MNYLLSVYNQIRTQIVSLDSSPMSLYYDVSDSIWGAFTYLIYVIHIFLFILVLEYIKMKEKIITVKKFLKKKIKKQEMYSPR